MLMSNGTTLYPLNPNSNPNSNANVLVSMPVPINEREPEGYYMTPQYRYPCLSAADYMPSTTNQSPLARHHISHDMDKQSDHHSRGQSPSEYRFGPQLRPHFALRTTTEDDKHNRSVDMLARDMHVDDDNGNDNGNDNDNNGDYGTYNSNGGDKQGYDETQKQMIERELSAANALFTDEVDKMIAKNDHTCEKCLQKGHTQFECTQQEWTCHYCGQKGHSLKLCPRRRCFHCSKVGHWQYQCPYLKNTSS
ncbi:hypothetical protein RFI_16314 [Reticulomyxa filosa]|uniref:CCHC-type domain-containing protein n=1 Tax=Reticulomyxa filosa TaxID=46433 RepID=X6N3Q6_RETFI|nr:hypothetical protein RFI_16314 [Reticulomyxa filosa]|eukprot:ETO20895.1 hypothetical protein RFI_16314 [Reticulomyxa filosa]